MTIESQPKNYSLRQLDREMWLARRLEDHGANIFEGMTDPAIRKARFREAIKRLGIELVIAGSRGGKPVNYQDLFSDVFQEPLG